MIIDLRKIGTINPKRVSCFSETNHAIPCAPVKTGKV